MTSYPTGMMDSDPAWRVSAMETLLTHFLTVAPGFGGKLFLGGSRGVGRLVLPPTVLAPKLVGTSVLTAPIGGRLGGAGSGGGTSSPVDGVRVATVVRFGCSRYPTLKTALLATDQHYVVLYDPSMTVAQLFDFLRSVWGPCAAAHELTTVDGTAVGPRTPLAVATSSCNSTLAFVHWPQAAAKVATLRVEVRTQLSCSLVYMHVPKRDMTVEQFKCAIVQEWQRACPTGFGGKATKVELTPKAMASVSRHFGLHSPCLRRGLLDTESALSVIEAIARAGTGSPVLHVVPRVSMLKVRTALTMQEDVVVVRVTMADPSQAGHAVHTVCQLGLCSPVSDVVVSFQRVFGSSLPVGKVMVLFCDRLLDASARFGDHPLFVRKVLRVVAARRDLLESGLGSGSDRAVFQGLVGDPVMPWPLLVCMDTSFRDCR